MAEPRLTRHIAHAALHVAAILGDTSTPVVMARESYWRRATGGVYSTADLILAEDALVSAGFVTRSGDLLAVTPLLKEFVHLRDDDAIEMLGVCVLGTRVPQDVAERAEIHDVIDGLIDDPARREALLLELGQRWDDRQRREVGAIGEELVAGFARDELTTLGYPNLANAVRRVSLTSDQLGYDVVAPRVDAPRRLLEVKAVTATTDPLIFLSRAEADAGSRLADWALVVCAVHEIVDRTGEIVGWCQRSDIEESLPKDVAGSRWQSVAIEIERLALQPGLPRPSR